jgi:hypothetical protein
MMSEERESARGEGDGEHTRPGAVVRASIQRWSGAAWEVVQDGALFDGVIVMTDLTPQLRAVLDGLAAGEDDPGRLGVLIGPAAATGRAPEEFERVGVRAVTALRTPEGEYGEAEGVARLELERPSRHPGLLCQHLDVPALMPDLDNPTERDGDAPAPRFAGVPYLARLAALVAERDGVDPSAVPRSTGADRWTVVADALAAEAARTRINELDLCNPMMPRFGLGNFVCMVFACC